MTLAGVPWNDMFHCLQALLEQAERELIDYRCRHDELLDRLVKDKSNNAEEMNKMNAMVEELRAALKAKGIPTPRSSVSGRFNPV